MNNDIIEILSDAIKEYYGDYELEELCNRFDLEIEYSGLHPNHKKLVDNLIAQKYRDKHRRFLETILPKLLSRCEERILNASWEVNVFDEHMLPQLKRLQDLFAGTKKVLLQAKSSNRFFTKKEGLCRFLASAKTALTLVDPRVDKSTLECIAKVKTPIRLLTDQGQQDFGDDLGRFVSDFRANGHDIEIRRHLKLNDRFLIFNGRCWLASCSLIDVGKITLSIIECVDTKPVIVKEIGRKWREAKVFVA